MSVFTQKNFTMHTDKYFCIKEKGFIALFFVIKLLYLQHHPFNLIEQTLLLIAPVYFSIQKLGLEVKNTGPLTTGLKFHILQKMSLSF